jgi:serine/threonine protein kinase
MIGKLLAHYKITAQIGKGGMGDVYQAKDQKL